VKRQGRLDGSSLGHATPIGAGDYTGKGICFPQTPHLAQAKVPDQSFPESSSPRKGSGILLGERAAHLSRQRLHHGVALIAGLVQNQKIIGVGSVFVVSSTASSVLRKLMAAGTPVFSTFLYQSRPKPFRPLILSSAHGIDDGPRGFNRPGRRCGLEASWESTMTDGPTRCGRTERISITDRRIPRSWSKTDSVPKRTSDLEHGQRASLETGRGWRAKSARHGRKPPPDARRIFRATRFVSRRKTSANVRETGGTVDRRASQRVVHRL
jgi:hypothetical protein